MKELEIGTNEISNADYHADKLSLSSSNLKLLLKDPQQFYKEKILGLRDEVKKDFFSEGSFVHSLILEPEKVKEDYAIWPGLRKQGAEFKAWAEQQEGKTILSRPQELRCNNYFRAFKQQPVAKKILKGTKSEYTIVSELDGFKCKMRADAINLEEGYIVDVKTTSFGSDIDSFRGAVLNYGYDLSAAFYADIASKHYGKQFDFYFLVISKTELSCDVYKASFKTLTTGRKLYKKALKLYAKCMETGEWRQHGDCKSKKNRSSSDYDIQEL